MASTTQDVKEALSQYLQDKRYLVVIDGLVSTKWDTLLQALYANGKGSRVMLITTLESKEVAFVNQLAPPLKITNFDRRDSQCLFCRIVFGHDNQFFEKIFHIRISESERLLDKAQDDIFSITEGLPLAILVLGGLLRTRRIGDWDTVLKQLKSSNESNPKQVERILAISFGDLPIRLKSCFLYFAGFPKNTVFNTRRLVQLWAAEGFLQPDKRGETMEDIGHNNIRVLLSRRMISLVKKDLNGGASHIAINGRIHAFAESQAQKASFLVVHDNHVNILAPASVRRLYLQNYMQLSVHTTSLPMLWSILCDFAEDRSCNVEPAVGHYSRRRFWEGPLKNQGSSSNNDLRYHAFSYLQCCKFLRIIDLRGLRIRVVPHAVGDMVHVRYLGLRSRFITELPSSIARLTNLQTLDIKSTEVQKVAKAFWEIPTLRHVVAKKLRLPVSSVVLLSNMQTLTGFICSDPSANGINPLHNMVYLRYLQISGLTKQHWQGLVDVFENLESLLYLSLAGDDIPFGLFFKNHTLRRLQTLELFGRIDTSNFIEEDTFPLPNLTRLVLKLSMVDQMFIDKIGELPSLMELVLSENSYLGEKILFSEYRFEYIRSLVMANLTEQSELTIRPCSIPKIKRIVLSGCSKMMIKFEGDEREGDLENFMEELQEIVIRNMPPADFLIAEPTNCAFREKINSVAIRTKY